MKEVSFPEIPYNEYKIRRSKAREMMEKAGLDALLLFNRENITYYSGFRKTWDFFWLHSLIYPLEGDVTLVVPQITHRIAEKTSWVDDVRPWGGASHWGLPQDPVEIILERLSALKLLKGTIGMEFGPAMYPGITLSELDALRAGLKSTKIVNATLIIWDQRKVKTDWEVETYRRLCDITVAGFKAGLESLREGMTEREVLEIVWREFVAQGAHDTPMTGQVMMRGGMKDYDMSTPRPVDLPLKTGRQFFFDGGCGWKGYHTDMQRQACIDEPPELQVKLFDISSKGQDAAEAALGPGVKVSDVHKAAMSIIGETPKYLRDMGVKHLYSHHFMGHGEGLNVHEYPWITADNHSLLEPNMILSLEIPALDIPQFRVLGGFPEDIYLITSTGYENLTKDISRKQWVVK